VLERHGFLPHVSALVAGEDAAQKPDPAPLVRALAELGRSSAWMLGDNPVDVLAARRARAVPLAMAPGGPDAADRAEALRGHGPARLVDGLVGLRHLLEAVLPRG
jgi:phosphoglycolate phosphatase-like HAD superfamily hydrolase